MKLFNLTLLLISIGLGGSCTNGYCGFANSVIAAPDRQSNSIVNRSSRTLQECDFLLNWGKKLPILKLVECKSASGQLETLTAIYSVKGADAAKVEKFLQRQFGMDKLRFICCYWGTNPYKAQFRKDGYNYSIYMASLETLEKKWHRIPEFKVRVTKYLTEP